MPCPRGKSWHAGATMVTAACILPWTKCRHRRRPRRQHGGETAGAPCARVPRIVGSGSPGHSKQPINPTPLFPIRIREMKATALVTGSQQPLGWGREPRQQRVSNHAPFSSLGLSLPGVVRPCFIWNKCISAALAALGAPSRLLSRGLVGHCAP
jgi:hypothetical protein